MLVTFKPCTYRGIVGVTAAFRFAPVLFKFLFFLFFLLKGGVCLRSSVLFLFLKTALFEATELPSVCTFVDTPSRIQGKPGSRRPLPEGLRGPRPRDSTASSSRARTCVWQGRARMQLSSLECTRAVIFQEGKKVQLSWTNAETCLWCWPPSTALSAGKAKKKKKGLPDWGRYYILNQAVNVIPLHHESDLMYFYFTSNFYLTCFQRRQEDIFLNVVLGNEHDRDSKQMLLELSVIFFILYFSFNS